MLGWRRSRSTQTSKVSGSKFLLLFFYGYILFAVHVALQWLGVFFFLFLVFSLMLCQPFTIQLVAELIFFLCKFEAEKNNSRSVIVIPAHPVMTYCLPCPVFTVLING